MFIGIDIGTSAVKAILTDADCHPLGSASSALAISHPHPGWSEQHPEDWWRAVQTAVQALLDQHPGVTSHIRGLGLSGQMHGTVLLDRDDAVIRPAILWNDGRSAAQCLALQKYAPELANVAGVAPMTGFAAPKIIWLRAHEPETYARIHKLLLPKDYIGLQLHGEYVTDPCDAAGTWVYDEAARDWSDALCAATGVQRHWLPEVRDGSAIAGQLTANAAAALGLPPGLPVATGAADAAAGAVAVGAVSSGSGFLSLGTSGQIFVATGQYRAAPGRGIHSFAHCLPDTWFQMAAMLNGARPMSWFSEITGQSVGALLDQAESARTDRLPLFLPYLTGERTPHADSAIRGAFYGLGNATGRAEMMRAVLDAIAYSFADARDAIQAVTPLPSVLLAIGGGSRSDLLLQTIADVLGQTIHRGTDAEVGPALGAARLSAMSVGALTLSDIAAPPPVSAVFSPQDNTRHASRLTAYRALYEALKTVRDLPR
ncbi:xylulokinase [Puniceibacterium sp. IMCC21224]|uniref:xylulokinase n=1 Tax=Puniceibacterium sp. IMCC21224 TaxID=1618204 RepID=UPI00064DFA69|nr:xylulokinase [Puniceibacterium sp. IMCC21224]KMK66224.1 D-xylulose kinase [Puniceibacterium sp. IMCC21224]